MKEEHLAAMLSWDFRNLVERAHKIQMEYGTLLGVIPEEKQYKELRSVWEQLENGVKNSEREIREIKRFY